LAWEALDGSIWVADKVAWLLSEKGRQLYSPDRDVSLRATQFIPNELAEQQAEELIKPNSQDWPKVD
jgi:hypothetical protein